MSSEMSCQKTLTALWAALFLCISLAAFSLEHTVCPLTDGWMGSHTGAYRSQLVLCMREQRQAAVLWALDRVKTRETFGVLMVFVSKMPFFLRICPQILFSGLECCLLLWEPTGHLKATKRHFASELASKRNSRLSLCLPVNLEATFPWITRKCLLQLWSYFLLSGPSLLLKLYQKHCKNRASAHLNRGAVA